MNPLRFLLGVVALLVVCGASRGAEFRRMPVGPVEPEGNVQQSVPELSNPTVTTGGALHAWHEPGRQRLEPGARHRPQRPQRSDEEQGRVPGRKDDSQRSLPRLRKLFGRFRSQG